MQLTPGSIAKEKARGINCGPVMIVFGDCMYMPIDANEGHYSTVPYCKYVHVQGSCLGNTAVYKAIHELAPQLTPVYIHIARLKGDSKLRGYIYCKVKC